MIKINGKDVSGMLTDIKLKLVRTYKGDIERTQTGKIAAFPNSFVTPGFDLQFLGPREEIAQLEAVLLSSNLVTLIVNREELNIKGNFSCTTNDKVEVRDRGESSLRLAVSLVSDGSNITNSTGSAFTVKDGQTTVLSTCYFGKVYSVPNQYKTRSVNGYSLEKGTILVLGNVVLDALS